jgi:hypothetical protein
VGQIKGIVVLVKEPKGWGKPPFEKNKRTVECQQGALREWNAIVLKDPV